MLNLDKENVTFNLLMVILLLLCLLTESAIQHHRTLKENTALKQIIVDKGIARIVLDNNGVASLSFIVKESEK